MMVAHTHVKCYRCGNPAKRYNSTLRGVLCSSCKYEKNRKNIIKRAADWRRDNRDRFNAVAAIRYINKKRASIEAYGGMCVDCEENQIYFLCIDHIHNDGAIDRAKWRNKVSDIHTLLKLRHYPDGYQILCGSCNLKKEIHNRRMKASKTWFKNQSAKIRVMSIYGGVCACCGQNDMDKLVMDHVNGGGTQAKKSYPSRNVYLFLDGKPKNAEEFQILCQNCNQAKYSLGKCPHVI